MSQVSPLAPLCVPIDGTGLPWLEEFNRVLKCQLMGFLHGVNSLWSGRLLRPGGALVLADGRALAGGAARFSQPYSARAGVSAAPRSPPAPAATPRAPRRRQGGTRLCQRFSSGYPGLLYGGGN